LQETRGKVIEVDFTARRRVRAPRSDAPAAGTDSSLSASPSAAAGAAVAARRALSATPEYLLFWRPPARRNSAEYLGGRWDWGWTLFVWTSEAAVGPGWTGLTGGRGYVPQRLSREDFASFLSGARDIGGLLLDGHLAGAGDVIRAEPDQLIRRDEALTALGG
jgi:hypothetical protein